MADLLHEYLIDCDVKVALRVRASSAAEARRMIDALLDCTHANFGAWPNGEPALGEATVHARSIAEIDGEAMANARAVRDFEEKATQRSSEEPFKTAASALGWIEDGGYVFHRNHFDSWKEAMSWSGEEGHEDHPLYDSWRECCEAEDIEIAAEGV